MASEEELRNIDPGMLGWLKAGAKTTLNDVGANLFGIFDFGTGSGRVAGGDYSADAIIGAAGDVATVVGVGVGIYARAAAGATVEVGEIAEASRLPIKGYSEHGIEQAILRDGHGVSPRAILDAVRNPVDIIPQPTRGTTLFVGQDAVVSLNQEGRVVTTWAKNSRGWRY